MKLIQTCIAILCMVSISAMAAPKVIVAEPDAPLPETTLTRKGKVSKLDPAVPLYLTVDKNPKAEVIFKEIFSKRGFTMANEPGPGVTALRIGGLLEVRMAKMRPRIYALDDFVQNPSALALSTNPSDMSAKGQLAGVSTVAINAALALTGVINLASAIGSTGVGLGEASGVSGSFNNLLTGDSRGICIWPCDDWDKYFQTVALVVEETNSNGTTSKSGVKVFTKSETLYPIQLLQAGLGALSADLLGDPMPTVFGKITDDE